MPKEESTPEELFRIYFLTPTAHRFQNFYFGAVGDEYEIKDLLHISISTITGQWDLTVTNDNCHQIGPCLSLIGRIKKYGIRDIAHFYSLLDEYGFYPARDIKHIHEELEACRMQIKKLEKCVYRRPK